MAPHHRPARLLAVVVVALLGLTAAPCARAQTAAATASCHITQSSAAQLGGSAPPVLGRVHFREVPDTTPNAHVGGLMVEAEYQFSNLPPNRSFGFHIHQNGDMRGAEGFETTGKHFIAACLPEQVNCEADTTHGPPWSPIRHHGDMGNITSDALGTSSGTIQLADNKMSLTDNVRSIVGRLCLIHAGPDTGRQPFGDAGPFLAGGTVGVPVPAQGISQTATAPGTPRLMRVVCVLAGPEGTGLRAQVMISAMDVSMAGIPGSWELQARFENFAPGKYVIVWREYGDHALKDAGGSTLGALGPENDLFTNLDITVRGSRAKFQVGGIPLNQLPVHTFNRLPGRALTIVKDSTFGDQVAFGVIGMAFEDAALDFDGFTVGTDSAAPGRRGGRPTVAVIAAFLVLAALVAALLFDHRGL